MKQNKNKLFISLTGGLGNQLFQLAAGLSLAGKEDLYLVSSLSSPRKSMEGNVHLRDFTFPTRVKFLSDDKVNWITKKTAGFVLYNGVKFPNYRHVKIPIAAAFIRFGSSLIMSLHFHRKIFVTASKGVGYAPIILSKGNNLILGYFQTFRWAENLEIKKELASISYSKMSESIQKFVLDAAIELPLIVHVRLGDYVQEKDFGIPSKEYYKKGILYLLKTTKCRSIWLFSDQLEVAKDFLPGNLSVPIRLISEIDGSPAATFEVMRLGAGYVIANSTFSWWAAFLRKNEKSQVIAPYPWFQAMPDPVDLIPNDWHQFSSGFDVCPK